MNGYKKRTIPLELFETAVANLVSAAFPDDLYNPSNYEIQKRAIALIAFTPEIKIPEEQQSAFELLYSPNVCTILFELEENSQYQTMVKAAENAIAHRLKILEGSSFSATDRAIAKFLDTLNGKISQLDGSSDSVEKVIESMGALTDSIKGLKLENIKASENESQEL